MTKDEKKLVIVKDALRTIVDGANCSTKDQKKKEYIAVMLLLRLILGKEITKEQVESALPR